MNHPAISIKKTAAENLKGILLHYNQAAARLLRSKSNIHNNIHDARLCFKRIRSLLRLGRFNIGEQNYKELNLFYRDQARKLSSIRDITAMIELCEKMREIAKTDQIKKLINHIRIDLIKKRKTLMAGQEVEKAKNEVIQSLTNQETVIKNLLFASGNNQQLASGIRRVYQSGRKLYKLSVKTTDDHNLHEWRKQVKYLWYQLVILTPLWPEILTPLCKQVQTLSQLLGKHHDYFIFAIALQSMKDENKYPHEIKSLMASIHSQKRNLEIKALRLGAMLYITSPRQIEQIIKNLALQIKTS